jgi:hypothetical protein
MAEPKLQVWRARRAVWCGELHAAGDPDTPYMSLSTHRCRHCCWPNQDRTNKSFAKVASVSFKPKGARRSGPVSIILRTISSMHIPPFRRTFLSRTQFRYHQPNPHRQTMLAGIQGKQKKSLCSILPLPHVKDEKFPASMMPPPETNSKQQHRRVSHPATMIWTTLAALPIMARRERSRSIGALSRIQSEQAAKLGRSTVFVLALWKREGGRERQSKSMKVQSTLDFGPRHMHDPYAHASPALVPPRPCKFTVTSTTFTSFSPPRPGDSISFFMYIYILRERS